jgi:phosphate transport system permease protein
LIRSRSALADGQPMIWLTGGALAIGLAMIVGLLGLVLSQGLSTFWPRPVVHLATVGGRAYLGQVTGVEEYVPAERDFEALGEQRRAEALELQERGAGRLTRWLLRTGNYEDTDTHYDWVTQLELADSQGGARIVDFEGGARAPEWALVVERLERGRFYGELRALLDGDQVVAEDPEAVWEAFERHHGEMRALWRERRELERERIGSVNHRIEAARLAARSAELDSGQGSPEARAAWSEFEAVRGQFEQELEALGRERLELQEREGRYRLRLETAYGAVRDLPLAEIVRALPTNRMTLVEKVGAYLSRWGEFLTDDPREANSEGGVYPAIFGTVVMTLVMSIAVVPFGVLAALYLREYAKPGPLVSLVRIAINNLAGVPSIVFGVFGLGFFCYIVGASVDELLFRERLPNPTYGTGGLLWASFTLALLTLPVVIVATEEALAAVPSSMREGSYACGATKWQTIQRIVLPRALPGIMTGMILAIARGAGEVAPLMLVGAVKLAPELPIDGQFPYVHPERSFMHLGFHIYDLGFQSQNSEAAKPMVFTTTLLLIAIVVLLNLAAIWIRTHLRRRYSAGQV